jgi:hypothetical protein
VQRGLAVIAVVVSVALASAVGASLSRDAAAASPRAAAAPAVTMITLRGRKDISGPWRNYLYLKLSRGAIPVSFSVCAVVDSKKVPPSCHARHGTTIPKNSRLRLEQRRGTGRWKLVGVSLEPFLDARLSNDVAGNRYGTVHYRVTLRAKNGTILRTSNPFRVIWHR